MHVNTLNNISSPGSVQLRSGFLHTMHTYAPFLDKVLFLLLCFNNP
jgi:hypothetical protein